MSDTQPARARTAIIIAGVHRSGTSALTRVVNLLGAGISDRVGGANEYNKSGYWEPQRLLELDDRILTSQGLTWSDWKRPAREPSANETATLVKQAVALLNNDLGRDALFVMKDPRLCRLIPLWEQAFAQAEVAAAYVIPIRAPAEVAHSLNRRDGSSIQMGLAIWLRNALDAEAGTRGKRRAFMTFEALQDDWRGCMDKVAQRIALDWPNREDPGTMNAIDGFLDPGQRNFGSSARTAEAGETELARLCAAAHAAFLRLVAEPEAPEALAELDRIRATLDTADATAASLDATKGATLVDQLTNRLRASREGAMPLWEELSLLRAETQLRTLGLPDWQIGADTAEHRLRVLQRDKEAALETALDLANAIEDADNRLHAELLRARKIFERPFYALGRHMLARLHLGVARWKAMPARRRARSARSGEKRDPRQVYYGLLRLSDDLGKRRNPAQIERLRRQLRLEGCELTVTAIVPNYNHAPYLAQRLDSILNQSYERIDVIVLDDCSTDNSREIIDEYAARFPGRVRTLYNEENSGSVFAQWRKGCEAATGDLLWLCESDDFCEPDFAEQLVGAFLDPSVMLAFGKIQFADAEGHERDGLDHYRETAEPGIWSHSLTRPACEWFSNGFAVSNVIANVGGSIWRRTSIADSVWDQAKGYKIAGDWYLYSEIAGGGQITYVPEAKSYFRIHDRNTSVIAQRTDSYYGEYTKFMSNLKAQWPVPDATLDRFVDGAKGVYDAQPRGTDLAPFDSLIDRAALRALPRTRPHVLIVFLGFSYGGGEIFPINLANALHARGERVSMLQLYKEDDHDDVRQMLDPSIAVYDSEAVSRQGIDAFLEAAGISVIHSHIVSGEMFFFETHRTETRLPYIVTLHGSYEAMKATRAQIAAYGKHVTHWNYTADRNLEPIRPLAIEPARLHKMRNAMPLDPRPYGQTRAEMGIGEDAVVFTLIARGVQRKGWRVSVDAFRALAEAHPEREMHLLLVGEGEATDRVRAAGEAMPNVHLLGYQTEIHGIYRLSDVALAPTRFAGESFPLCLIQAMQTGTPIITSDVGQIPQMLRSEAGDAGILVPAVRDTAAFTEATRAAMEAMLEDATRADYARHAQEIGAQFSMDEIAEEYARQYRQSIADLGRE